jgi:response regulator RpfG family c-di-GMP phosphodiesterase
VEILSLVNPEAFGRSERIKRLALATAEQLKMKHVWRLELAAMLSHIGCVSIPEDILSKKYSGRSSVRKRSRYTACTPPSR